MLHCAFELSVVGYCLSVIVIKKFSSLSYYFLVAAMALLLSNVQKIGLP